jgi:hypothetical protein
MPPDPHRIEFDPLEEIPTLPAAAPPGAQRAETELQPGKGLDVGTANLLSAVRRKDGKVVVKRERNMFLEPSTSPRVAPGPPAPPRTRARRAVESRHGAS